MFADLLMTEHVQKRMRQRGLREGDIPLLLRSASQIAEDAFLLTDQDAAREIAQRKHEIQCLERLKGVKVVLERDALVTCYHTRREGQKAALRRGRAFR